MKTTDFGAFVELKKGTDGLLHVSNVGPGRVAHIEDVISRGDVLDVIVQEVDKMRGRIGPKLVAKHEDGVLVQPEADRARQGGTATSARSARATESAAAAAVATGTAGAAPRGRLAAHLKGCRGAPRGALSASLQPRSMRRMPRSGHTSPT